MENKVKVPGGAFYAGDGLTVDPITRTVSAGGGDVTTPDWNQNDETASDYIKNRPGGYLEYTNVGTINKTANFTQTSGNKYQYNGEIVGLLNMDTIYNITFNGVLYENVPISPHDNTFILGDWDLVNYPFALGYRVYIGGGTTQEYNYSSVGGEINITIVKLRSKPVLIPKNLVEPPSSLSVGASQSVITSGSLTYLGTDRNKYMELNAITSITQPLVNGENKTMKIVGTAETRFGEDGGSSYFAAIGTNGYGTNVGYIILSTASNKKFKITVNDNGELSATEVTT